MNDFNEQDILSEIDKMEEQMNDIPVTIAEIVQRMIITNDNAKKLREMVGNQQKDITTLFNQNTELTKIVTELVRNSKSGNTGSTSDEIKALKNRIESVHENSANFRTIKRLRAQVATLKHISIVAVIISIIGLFI